MAINDQEKMLRQLRLLLLLAGSRRYTLQDLATRFGISERTVYRYLNTFKSAGFVTDEKEGAYRLVTNNDPARSLGKLFHFSEEEAYILCQVLERTEGSVAVKDKLIHKLHALYDLKALAEMEGDRSVENISALREAIDGKKRVLLQSYRSSNSQTITDREIEPFHFLPDYEAVWGFDPEKKQNKQFKISRMGTVTILANGWQHETHHSIPFMDAFRMSASKPINTVEATLTLKAWNLLREEFPLASEHVIPSEDGLYLLNIPIADFNGIGRFVLGLGEEIKVKGPKAFLEFLRKKTAFFAE